MDRIFLKRDKIGAFQSVTNLIIHHYFKDLELYYSAIVKDEHQKEVPARLLIQQKLIQVLRKHQDKDIFLIAHSMGSIIAYETLTLLEKEISIDTLVTVGSPLGQPVVMSKFLSESLPQIKANPKPSTPESIKKQWHNLSDLEDHVAMNYNLADDYGQNSFGVMPQDHVVYNNYTYEKKRNPHKSYGYLRTAELAQILYQFLSRDRSKWGFWLSNRYYQFRQRFFGNNE
jgi:hypothetical protein